jgi:hypothetical protein
MRDARRLERAALSIFAEERFGIQNMRVREMRVIAALNSGETAGLSNGPSSLTLGTTSDTATSLSSQSDDNVTPTQTNGDAEKCSPQSPFASRTSATPRIRAGDLVLCDVKGRWLHAEVTQPRPSLPANATPRNPAGLGGARHPARQVTGSWRPTGRLRDDLTMAGTGRAVSIDEHH